LLSSPLDRGQFPTVSNTTDYLCIVSQKRPNRFSN
jgi:hypothetical protein